MKNKEETRAKSQRRQEEKTFTRAEETEEENIFTRAEEQEGKNIFTRAESASAGPTADREALTYRTVAIGARAEGGPASLDEKTRSIEVVGATENPVEVWDWERFEIVREVCLMSGCVLPANRQTVLLDSHERYGTGSVVGSYRDMRIEEPISSSTKLGGLQMVGRAYFTSLPEGDAPYIKVKEGHVTDFSVGYRVLKSQWVKAGETSVIQGRTFEGPLRVTTRWVPREMSVCPFGGDEMAKVRGEFEISNLKTKKENEKEEQTMNKKLRELLIERGMAENATDDEAWEFLVKFGAAERAVTGTVATATKEGMDSGLRRNDEKGNRNDGPSSNVETISREAIRIERERVTEIDAMCVKFEVPKEERDAMVTKGMEIDQARKAVMDLVEKRQKENPQRLPTYPMIEGVADEGEKFRAAAEDSLILRGGKQKIATPASGALELRGYTMRELSRLCLQRAGIRVPFDIREMIGRAMVTGDLPIILSNVANKSLFAGFNEQPESWRIWCATGPVSDYKTNTSARASETDDLDKIAEHGEYKYGKMSEGKEEYALEKYGKLFAISREAIINDDLGVLTSIPRKHGEAAARMLGDIAYAILTLNAAMGDSKALFIAAHLNIGTGGALSEVTCAEGVKLMGTQKDIGGKRRLNIPATYFIGPRAIEGSARVFFGSTQFSKTNEAATRKNVYADPYFTQVYEGRLDDNSETQYYFAGPKGKTVTIFFLDGIETPFLDTRAGFTVDGVEYKVRLEAVAKAMDWKALVRNAGL